MKTQKLFAGLTAATITLSLGLFMAPAASAVQPAPGYSSTAKNGQVDLEQIEEEVKFLFETASSYEDGKVTINKTLLEQKYGKQLGALVAAGIERIYTQENLAAHLKYEMQIKSWLSCMKSEIIGMVPGMDIYDLFANHDLVGYIKGYHWGKVAELLGKVIAKTGMKTNVAGLIAQLVVSSGKCAIWG